MSLHGRRRFASSTVPPPDRAFVLARRLRQCSGGTVVVAIVRLRRIGRVLGRHTTAEFAARTQPCHPNSAGRTKASGSPGSRARRRRRSRSSDVEEHVGPADHTWVLQTTRWSLPRSDVRPRSRVCPYTSAQTVLGWHGCRREATSAVSWDVAPRPSSLRELNRATRNRLVVRKRVVRPDRAPDAGDVHGQATSRNTWVLQTTRGSYRSHVGQRATVSWWCVVGVGSAVVVVPCLSRRRRERHVL